MAAVTFTVDDEANAASPKFSRRLSAAQRRFTRACETLARVRKLSRNTPTLQFNIATNGGQQVKQSLLEFDKLRFYKRIWRLPLPQSAGGTWATVLFYLYAFTGLTNVVTMLLYYSGQLPDYPFKLRFWLMNLGTSVAVVVISRYAAIRSARAAGILERAKRQLLADECR